MRKIYFASVLHFHQPVGNFEHIFERAYRLCYHPLLLLLLKYPEIRMSFHFSGSLLDYLEAKHPEILNLLDEMVSRGQIEMLGGGYYEPIFTAIPKGDLKGQIEMMSDYLKKRFNFSPQGIWIPERVWEPHLAGFISKMGIRYSILDDMHLFEAGIKKKDIRGYFLTSSKFAVFASDKTLRYNIPFHAPSETINYFRTVSSDKENNVLFVYGDDGEKFGEWPGTYRWVYKQGWLKNFFDFLIKNKDWLETIKLSDYLENNKPQGRVKIPPASYREMIEWTGGSWMNFLAKYPESNQMHKKMCYVSKKIEKLRRVVNKKEEKKLEQAKRELYKGQCNCAYWHGVFGGLYLYHLRQAIYSHLIKAEKIADELLRGNKKERFAVKQIDYDLDKKDEIIMESKAFSLYLDPDEGGVIKELDYRPLSLNLINTLSRKKERYHREISKTHSNSKARQRGVHTIHSPAKVIVPEFKERLYYDKFPRYCLRDHFIKKELKIEDFMNSFYEELGGFADGEYTVKHKGGRILLERKAKVLETELSLSKEIKIESKGGLRIFYYLKKYNASMKNILLGIEFNITMPYLNSPRYRYFFNAIFLGGLSARGSLSGVDSFGIADSQKELEVRFHFSQKPEEIWYFPIMTVSQSEKGYKSNYQSSCILPRWKPDFDKSGLWNLKIGWELEGGHKSTLT